MTDHEAAHEAAIMAVRAINQSLRLTGHEGRSVCIAAVALVVSACSSALDKRDPRAAMAAIVDVADHALTVHAVSRRVH